MAQWDFTLDTGVELRVQPGSGHWSQVIDTDTLEVKRSVYVYEAEVIGPDGKRSQIPVFQKTLRMLRKKAALLL